MRRPVWPLVLPLVLPLLAAGGCVENNSPLLGGPLSTLECGDFIVRADELIASAGDCTTEGEPCMVVDGAQLAGPSSCLEAFQCGRGYATTVDVAALTRDASELAAAYREKACGSCATAECTDATYAVCVGGRCQLGIRPSSRVGCDVPPEEGCPEDELCYLSQQCNMLPDGSISCMPPLAGDRQCHRECGSDGQCGIGETCTEVQNFYMGTDRYRTQSVCLLGS